MFNPKYLTIMKNYLLLALAAVALCFTACKKDNPEPKPVAVTGVSLDKTMVGLEIDESATVQAVITPSNATNKAVEWSVADTAVATVSNGVVTGVAVGETTLTATTVDGGFTATIPVKVVTEKIPVTGIDWAASPPYGFQCEVGYTRDYAVEILPNNATDMGVTFTSSNPEVATVKHHNTSNNFVAVTFTAVGEGKVTITATTNDGGFTTTTPEILVVAPTMVEFVVIETPSKDKIAVGETLQLEGGAYPNEASNRTLEWISSDPSVATVSNSGLVRGIAEGKVTITAKSTDGSNKEDSVEIQVFEGAIPTSLTFSDETLTGWHGKVFEATPTQIVPSNGNLKALNWGSYYETRDEVDIVVERSKVKFSLVEQTHSGISEPYQFGIKTYTDRTEVIMARVATQMFLFKSLDSNGKPKAQIGVDYLKYLYDSKERPDAGNYYFAAYWKDGNPSGGGHYNYVNSCTESDYIPATEYTLTSSHPNKWKVTRVNNYVCKIEDLDPTTYQELTITYKCNKWERIMTFQVIPQ